MPPVRHMHAENGQARLAWRICVAGEEARDVTMGDTSAPGALLKDLSPAEYSRVSALLDQAIEMAPEARDAWLLELERGDAKAAAVLRDMFASMDGGQAQGFLEMRDLVVDSVASMLEEP